MPNTLTNPEETQVMRPLSVLVPLIKKDLAEASEAVKSAGLPFYRAAGAKMLEAKGQMKHGAFTSWLANNFKLSKTTAAKYMEFAAATSGTHNSRVQDFSSLNDFHRQTGSAAYMPNKPRPQAWHEGVKDNIERARMEAKRIQAERLTREQERAVERKMALRLIDIGFKVLAKELHPDKGGTRDAMSRLSRVRDRLKSHA